MNVRFVVVVAVQFTDKLIVDAPRLSDLVVAPDTVKPPQVTVNPAVFSVPDVKVIVLALILNAEASVHVPVPLKVVVEANVIVPKLSATDVVAAKVIAPV